eukprot:TRINITY_DN12162_c0_g1_i1.p1 TRINITY_DN12162_c0_g1~~TRINITY_DN12162_c0_g1_i1.p1  ORF type:complete len:796 (+),score=135.11 TRINITY_DN12162_c0_g1_i1:160-2547(+)
MEALRPRTAECMRDAGGLRLRGASYTYTTPPPPREAARPAGRSVVERLARQPPAPAPPTRGMRPSSAPGPRPASACARPVSATPTPHVVHRGGAWRKVPPRSATRAETRGPSRAAFLHAPRPPQRPHSAMDGRPTYSVDEAAQGAVTSHRSASRSPKGAAVVRRHRGHSPSHDDDPEVEEEVQRYSRAYLADSQASRKKIHMSCDTVRGIIEDFEERVGFDEALARADIEIPDVAQIAMPDFATAASTVMNPHLDLASPSCPSLVLTPQSPAYDTTSAAPSPAMLPSAASPARRASVAALTDEAAAVGFTVDPSKAQQDEAQDLYLAIRALHAWTEETARKIREAYDCFVPPPSAAGQNPNAAAQQYLQLDAESKHANTAVRCVETLRFAFGDLTTKVIDKDEQVASLKHQLGRADERVRGAVLRARAEKSKNVQLRCAARWQRLCLRGQRTRLRHAHMTASLSETAQQHAVEQAVLFCSLEHAASLCAITPAVGVLWGELLKRCCEFAGAKCTTGIGCASGRGYAYVLFGTPDDAVAFALKLQHALLHVAWPDEIDDHKMCPTKYASDVAGSDPTAQRAQYFMQYGDPEDAKSRLDLEQLAHIAEGIGLRRCGLPSDVGLPPVFKGPRVRMSVHHGVVLHDDGCFGPTLMKGSLLCGKARPGEVLMSDAVWRMVREWLQSERMHVASTTLPQMDDAPKFNWNLQGRGMEYNAFERGEQAHSVYSEHLLPRMALFPPTPTIFEHEMQAYNPHWWLRYCNYPVVDEPAPPPPPRATARFEGYERLLMHAEDADAVA